MGCSRGVPGLFRAVPGCSGGVLGMFRAVPGVFRGVLECSGVFRVLQTPAKKDYFLMTGWRHAIFISERCFSSTALELNTNNLY